MDKGSRLGDIRIDQLTRVSIDIKSQSGGPARSSRLTILPDFLLGARGGNSYLRRYERSQLDRLAAQRPLADRRGRITLLLPDYAYDVFVLGQENEFLVDRWQWKAVGKGQWIEKTVNLDAMAVAEGTVLDRNGDPLPGVTLRTGGWSGTGIQLHSFLMAANQEAMRASSDAEGKFRMPYIPAKNGWLYVWITAQFGAAHYATTQRIKASAEGQTGLELRTSFPKRVPKRAAKTVPRQGK